MSFVLVVSFISCKEKDEVKKESWAVVIDFFSPDPSYYPAIRKFPFPDSLRFEPLETFFTNQNKKPTISDSSIIFYDSYNANGMKLCCIKDTLELYIDSIQGRKYLFAIGEYISVFQSNNNADTNLRVRKMPDSIPLWGIQLNVPYPVEKFKNEYEKLGARHVKLDTRFDEVSKQAWNDNDSIYVETIQFNNSTDRVITALYKDIKENEVRSIIDQMKNRFPAIKLEEGSQTGNDGKTLKLIRMYYQGVSVSFTQNTETEYSFMITDYYETLKLIIRNAEAGYIFREDVKIY
jgi:hypothetical protein